MHRLSHKPATSDSILSLVNDRPNAAARRLSCARIDRLKPAPPALGWTGREAYPTGLFAARSSLRADQVTTPKKKAKARTMTVNCRRRGETGDVGTGRGGEIQGDAQVDGGGLRLTGAVVDDEDVVAGLADAEVERAGLGARGDGEKTVGEIGTQILQGGAGHESQTDGFGTGLHVEAGVDAGGILAQVDLDVLPLGRGHLVDLVHEFDGSGGGQQGEAGKGGHGTGRTGRRGTIRSMNDSMAQPGPWLVRTGAPD